ncbi:MAG TPA: O-antigen ligase family protein [Bacteroidales bacterium]|nr:O-antigen ligase family protein [Bacteroidales bacterium]
MNSDTAAIVNNLGYSFTGLMPFVFLINKKKIISGLLMAVLLVFIIQSSKRGAIIAGSFALIMYFYLQLITIGKNERISGYIIVPLVIAGLALFVYRESASNELLINRMTSMIEGNTSGRDVIYRTLLDHWYNKDNVFNLLFGFGFASSLDITGGSYAHNDWLELLSNFGIFGVLVYITLFFSALSLFFNKLWPEEKRILFLTILIIWFFISLVSMWYTSVEGFMQASLMGYILGNESPDPDQNFHSIST